MRFITALFALALTLGLQTTPPVAPALEPGFVSLFNGKDLSGWTVGKTGTEDLTGKTDAINKRVEVKDGIIVMNAKDAGGAGMEVKKQQGYF